MVDRHFLPDFIFGENFYASDILRALQLLPIVFETSLSVSSVPFEGDEAYESEARKVADEIGTGAIRLLDYTSTSNLAYLRVVAAILVEMSIISYADLGVTLVDGRVPLPILAEHLVIIHKYNLAIQGLTKASTRGDWSVLRGPGGLEVR